MQPVLNYKGQVIKVRTFNGSIGSIVVFYPGIGYSLDSPLFFYLEQLYREKGWSILGFDYRYNENTDFMDSEESEQDTWFEYDSNSIGKAVREECKGYARVMFVGKSLGTTMIMKQMQEGLIGNGEEIVWLTPGKYVHEIYTTILEKGNKSLVIYGTEDRNYREQEVQRINGKVNIVIKEIEKAGHSLEEEGNVERSIENIKVAIAAVEEFIRIY